MLKTLPLALVALTLALPMAQATEIEENETLVTRLIFEDCLDFLRHETEPFSGLDTSTATPEASQWLPDSVLESGTVVQFLSPRYVAAWGADEEFSYCMVRTAWSDPLYGEGLLGVEPATFLDRVSTRATEAGLTVHQVAEELSPVMTSGWYEPETGKDVGPDRPISLAILPTDANKDESLMDIGLIIMSGPGRSGL